MTSCLCRTLQYARQNPADFRSSIVEDSSEFYNSGEIFSAETVSLATPAAEVRTGVVRLDRHLKTTESILPAFDAIANAGCLVSSLQLTLNDDCEPVDVSAAGGPGCLFSCSASAQFSFQLCDRKLVNCHEQSIPTSLSGNCDSVRVDLVAFRMGWHAHDQPH